MFFRRRKIPMAGNDYEFRLRQAGGKLQAARLKIDRTYHDAQQRFRDGNNEAYDRLRGFPKSAGLNAQGAGNARQEAKVSFELSRRTLTAVAREVYTSHLSRGNTPTEAAQAAWGATLKALELIGLDLALAVLHDATVSQFEVDMDRAPLADEPLGGDAGWTVTQIPAADPVSTG
jgi:hypothetical protein